MSRSLEVLFTPADFAALRQRDLSQTTCVVFDVLRATTTMLTALDNGAAGVIPVAEISEALALKQKDPNLLLAGERDGLRIRSNQTGSIDFDLGNSPREFTKGKIAGRTIAITTTNGTRALKASAAAQRILLGGVVNLQVVADYLMVQRIEKLLLICSGTHDQAAYEDTLAVGALCDLIWPQYQSGNVEDSALMARTIYLSAKDDLLEAMRNGRNGRRLMGIPELAEDVRVCAERDRVPMLAAMSSDGVVRRIS